MESLVDHEINDLRISQTIDDLKLVFCVMNKTIFGVAGTHANDLVLVGAAGFLP